MLQMPNTEDETFVIVNWMVVLTIHFNALFTELGWTVLNEYFVEKLERVNIIYARARLVWAAAGAVRDYLQ